MQRFEEHYFQEKITSELRRAFTTNIFKKRVVGIDLGKGQFKTIVPADQGIFTRLKEDIRKEVVRVNKAAQSEKFRTKPKFEKKSHKSFTLTTPASEVKQKIKKKFGDIYVSQVYEGEIDSGEEHLEGDPMTSIVYELSNGGKIAFVTTEEPISRGGQSGSKIRRYIATAPKGNDFFRKNLGTTIQQIGADAKKSDKLIDTGGRPDSAGKELERIMKSVQSNKSLEIPKSHEIGIMDIKFDEYENLKKIWGTGRKGGLVRGETYPFRGKFTRGRYESDQTGYTGYKYSDGEHTVYLIDTGDGSDAFIAFDGRESLDWSENIEMLSAWRGPDHPSSGIRWQSGTIEDLE